MPLDPDVVEAVREMDEHELRRLLMLARARLESRGVEMGAEAPRVRYREQLIRCGKSNCTRCPHGPYWYAYWNEDGRRRSCYLGRLEADEVPSAMDRRGFGNGVAGNL